MKPRKQHSCRYRQQRGFSMLELLIAGILILLLVTATYRQYMAIVVDAEYAAYNGVRGWLQAGLNMALSDAVIGNNRVVLTELEASNPMALLEGVMEPPSNYLGELSGAAAEQAEPGNWYFDSEQRTLYYRFRYQQRVNGAEQLSGRRIGFRLLLVKRPSVAGGAVRTPGKMVKLERVEP